MLDEPNSNLDGEGEAALTAAIESVKKRGGIVIVIAHRPSALSAVDLVAVVQNGKMSAFGPRDQIISGGGVKAPDVKVAPVPSRERAKATA